MKNPIRTVAARTVLPLLIAAALAGCTSNKPYHTSAGTPGACTTGPASDECRNSYYQAFQTHDVAFAEFTERGNAFDDQAVDDVLRRIGDKARANGVVVLVFIHGWKHSASEDDGNVRSFKRVLQTMGDMLSGHFSGQALGERRLIGLYVGWRGANITVPFVEEVTFWDRKAVAEELGSGGITRLLLDLDSTTAQDAKNVLVVIGHSFGGAIVVRALTDVFTERVTNRGDNHRARIFGDGVLVLNPAIEANQALPFVEAAVKSPYAANQLPMFISISSDADGATHRAFPLGQTIGLWNWRQAELRRNHYYDRRQPAERIPLDERHLDATTVGNFAPFLTHRLRATSAGDEPAFSLTPCHTAPQDCEPMGWTTLTGQPTIGPLPPHYPLYFIRTDASIITEHNDVFNAKVRSFVFTVVDDVVRRTLQDDKKIAAADQPPIIADPARFTARMKEIWTKMPADAGQ